MKKLKYILIILFVSIPVNLSSYSFDSDYDLPSLSTKIYYDGNPIIKLKYNWIGRNSSGYTDPFPGRLLTTNIGYSNSKIFYRFNLIENASIIFKNCKDILEYKRECGFYRAISFNVLDLKSNYIYENYFTPLELKFSVSTIKTNQSLILGGYELETKNYFNFEVNGGVENSSFRKSDIELNYKPYGGLKIKFISGYFNVIFSNRSYNLNDFNAQVSFNLNGYLFFNSFYEYNVFSISFERISIKDYQENFISAEINYPIPLNLFSNY